MKIVATHLSTKGGPCQRCGEYIEVGEFTAKVDVGYRGRQTEDGNGRGAWWCKRCINKVFDLEPPARTVRVRHRR